MDGDIIKLMHNNSFYIKYISFFLFKNGSQYYWQPVLESNLSYTYAVYAVNKTHFRFASTDRTPIVT